ncbi:nucleotide exchange factor GrpE [Erysipelothrix urinaevulpis]|uniref:nucleotide exchange factor GrpE n=1 Tax=Erysipelothrix urinaevulpis TaxID=2683717 RepID=UPI002E2BC0AA|nr:nucleotide exchange factor GrpE [Erysipelothrix urinaevulpis]
MSKKTEDLAVNEEETLEENVESEETVELNEEDILKKEIEILENELKSLKEDGLKVRAEADNFKKRLQRDHDLSQKYKIQNFALEILPALDNFERALLAETKDEALHEGVSMIYEQLKSSLEREGVVAIEALNKEFDPNLHQAVVMEKQEDVEANIVIEEFQKGYMIKDRILRPSMVKVSE